MLEGKTTEALASFDVALELQPSLAEARFNRAVTLLRAKQYARASAEFERVWSAGASPLRARAAYHDALALDALGRGSDAEVWLTRALETDSALDSALLYLGALRERRGDLQAAGKAYKQFLDKHPDVIVAMLRFGVAAQRAGFSEVGRKYLQRVIDTAPDSTEAAEARKFLVLWE
jgi:tetratricopeptide (TPR) repeat protein